ncbi:Spc98 family-domain-containing protein [Mucidula mucida]|nr:Spc98 family-domain-containing protein [Mucidula mucida]
MDYYTPRTKTGARHKNITLTAREYSKITGTIASVRRNRRTSDDGTEDINGRPSFIAETSFVRAPLNSRVRKGRQNNLDHVPLDIQESIILEDLLYVLMGIEGTHITYHPDYSPGEDDPLQGVRFTVAPSLDSSLQDLVERILPLGTYYTAISSFIEHRSDLDYGLHAFNFSPQFSLQKLWFYVHPTIHTLSLLYQLVIELGSADDPSAELSSSSSDQSSELDPEEEARNEALGIGGAKLKAVMSEMDKNGLTDSSGIAVKGGEVLTIIYERMQNMSGDPTANTLYGTLLREAGKPYAAMLKMWITTGRLDDPHEELLVKESKFINRGILEMDYTDEWHFSTSAKRQAGVPPPRSVGGRLPGGACVPPLLEGWKHKILLAGKYLNVIRECGIENQWDSTTTRSYSNANRTLLQLLLKDQQLIPRLRSLKRYFFLSQSFFLTHFLDLAHTELRNLLELALNTDVHGDDTLFREDVKVTMTSSGLYEWLMKVVGESGQIGNGDEIDASQALKRDKEKDPDKKPLLAIDALAFDYSVKFPLSLVVSRKTILRYQLLFRFLLHLKHVEQSLSAMWIEHKTTVWRRQSGENTEFDRWRARVFLLRARMLSFIQQILAFATFEVLEPNWRALEAKLEKVSTVDQLLRDHVDFLDTCLKECMLTSSKLLKAFSRLIVTCSTFAMYTAMFTKSANQASASEDAGETDEQGKAKRWDVFLKFETNFNHWFKIYLDCVQFYASSENVSLLPLVVRLNSVKATAST